MKRTSKGGKWSYFSVGSVCLMGLSLRLKVSARTLGESVSRRGRVCARPGNIGHFHVCRTDFNSTSRPFSLSCPSSYDRRWGQLRNDLFQLLLNLLVLSANKTSSLSVIAMVRNDRARWARRARCWPTPVQIYRAVSESLPADQNWRPSREICSIWTEDAWERDWSRLGDADCVSLAAEIRTTCSDDQDVGRRPPDRRRAEWPLGRESAVSSSSDPLRSATIIFITFRPMLCKKIT